jgi:hypothetical protein
MNRRIQATEADQVIQVVYIVVMPVVFRCVAEVSILNSDLFELFPAPAQLLVNVVDGNHGAVGKPYFFPVQWYRGGYSFF